MKLNLDNLSLFWMCTGPRGSDKTLLNTSFAARRLLKAHYSNYYLGTNQKVWTNYPISFYHHSLAENKTVKLESLPLNREALMMFDDEYVEGTVFIDEIDQWYDKQEWQDASQKMTTKMITQIRKKKLSLGGTIQDIGWVNSRLGFQVDIQIECRDAVFTPFGRKNNMDPGECAFLKWKDLSGYCTGYTFKETQRVHENIFWGKAFWGCYDTNFSFDPTESMTKYKFKRATKVIDLSGDNSPDAAISEAESLVPFTNVVGDLVREGHTDHSIIEIVKRARQEGFNGNISEAKKLLKLLNVVPKSNGSNRFNLELAEVS